jgi:thiol-disulfide isomerase/thioredoxin
MTPKAKTWLKWGLLGVGIALAVRVMFESSRAAMGGHSKLANFSGTDIRGKRFSLADYRGHQPVIIDFFATWCGPCQMEWPELEAAARKYQDKGLVVVAVTKESAQEVNVFPKYQKSPIRVLPDGAAAGDAYGASEIPHTFFFNAKGELVGNVEGYTPDSLRHAIKSLGL